MPPLQGFSDNAFLTHHDSRTACISLLRALKPYQSPGGARITLPLSTGTHFDEVAAQLEGYARALWAVGTLLHSGTLTPSEHTLISPYIEGLANGTDPQHGEYWGPVVLRDQRMVEMEIISFALLSAPDEMFHSQTPHTQKNITTWLQTINGKDFPQTNWLWFRITTNLALVKVCATPYLDVQAAMTADLDMLEAFYLGEGWAADGLWNDQGRQADYYSGSFAIQFSQLVYARFAADIDAERCARFRARARSFALSFWRYFDTNGAAIPFGRSLTYRFAFAGFWAAVAFADVELPAPLDDWGVVRGLLLRHFRWWSEKTDMFNVDGTLTIGFCYPNLYLAEDYNSPQSVYWALKSFLALGVPETHAFWTAPEKPLPLSTTMEAEADLAVPVKPPMHIVCQTGNHHFLLSAGQFCPWPLKATEAKYGKYAYSSHFTFSVPTGPILPQSAPDSTLSLSKDGGDTLRMPWKPSNPHFTTAKLYTKDGGGEGRDIPALQNTWTPWRDADVQVETTLIAPCARFPDWYLRVHKLINRGSTPIALTAVQGGFAIQGRGATRGEVLPSFTDMGDLASAMNTTIDAPFPEGTFQSNDGVLICSSAGASGIRALPLSFPVSTSTPQACGEVLKPDANTSLSWQRTLIPTLTLEMEAGGNEVMFASAVFAVSRTADRGARYAGLDIRGLWEDIPVIGASGIVIG